MWPAVHLILKSFSFVVVSREEKKKKQKQEGCDTEKSEITSGGSAVDPGSKGGGGPSQQPLKRGQKVRQQFEGVVLFVQLRVD